MTKEELQKIKQRCEAATPGPWKTASKKDTLFEHNAVIFERVCEKSGEMYRSEASIMQWTGSSGFADTGEAPQIDDEFTGNYEFIAHARTDIPALLAYIEELEGEKA